MSTHSATLVRWLTPPLRLPSDSAPETGAGTASNPVYKPAPNWLLLQKVRFWSALLLTYGGGALVVIISFRLIEFAPGLVLWLVSYMEMPLYLSIELLATLFPLIAGFPIYIALLLRYELTSYNLGPDSVRLRRGAWTIRESTISYANIQNVTVRQGPLQRAAGISDVMIETAGGQSPSSAYDTRSRAARRRAHLGLIEGVVDARALRDSIIARARSARPQQSPAAPSPARADRLPFTPAHIACLQEILSSVKMLICNEEASA